MDTKLSLSCQSLPDGTVDLHGLYVAEALAYAKQEFQSVVSRSDKAVRFIVGTFPLGILIGVRQFEMVLYGGFPMNLGKGLHAKDGKVKIRPALEKLCKE